MLPPRRQCSRQCESSLVLSSNRNEDRRACWSSTTSSGPTLTDVNHAANPPRRICIVEVGLAVDRSVALRPSTLRQRAEKRCDLVEHIALACQEQVVTRVRPAEDSRPRDAALNGFCLSFRHRFVKLVESRINGTDVVWTREDCKCWN